MISTRGKWLRAALAALGAAVVTARGPSAWAQGFGTDPFRPYNSQYDPYTVPLGPAFPDAAQSAAALSRGIGGANQFQNYLNQVQGIARSEIERYGIGMPYYQRAVDPLYDREGKREYRPNRQSKPVFEDTQKLITEKYLAYFAERDPEKRVKLIRDYERTRRNVTRALSTNRGANPTEALERAAGFGAAGASRARLDRAVNDLPIGRSGARDLDRAGIAPPLRGRAGGSSAAPRSTVLPPAPRPGRRARQSADPEQALDRATRLRDLSPRPTRPERNRTTSPDEPPASSRDE
jgi:hypothetical protein